MDEMMEGLEPVQAEVTKTKKEKKVQTAEEREVLVVGVEKLKELGVSENLQKVLVLATDWNADKETLGVAKEATIESFGGSDAMKDYISGEFTDEFKPWMGISKLMPILNNIRSFYARRASNSTGTSRSKKTTQVRIAGDFYKVNKEYFDSLVAEGKSKDEIKELILTHADTKKIEIAEVL